jgi:prepilin signal peptidase PulO-like enzyme (type II secretory pathway)
MIIAVLVVFGLCLGSFINALVWRLHEQAKETGKDKPDKKYLNSLSIGRGRSMCPVCKHELGAKDLVPLLSWLGLKGKCRYCRKPISGQYPLVEAATAAGFVASYIWWPVPLQGWQIAVFVLWLALLAGLVALLVYDLRWLLLPNRIIYPLGFIAAVQAVIIISIADKPLTALLNTALGVAVGGGIFYVLFQVSEGKWIGGGDVKLGWLLGLLAATPARSLLFIFIAALSGSLVSLPLLANGRLKRTSTIPFGPFLIIGAIIVQLFGVNILHWYQTTFITF